MGGYIERDRQGESEAEMTERRRAEGERLIRTFTFCSMHCRHSAGKRGDVKTRRENEKNKREENESADAEMKDAD